MNHVLGPELTSEQITDAWVKAWDALPDQWVADPMQRYQSAGYNSTRMVEWLAAYHQGEMVDLNLMTLMLQSVLEHGRAHKLDLDVLRCATHFVNAGLCTIHGRTLQ